jgi:plastocyanin
LIGTPGSVDTSIYGKTAGCGESPFHKSENWKVGTKNELADVVLWVVDPKILPRATVPPPPFPAPPVPVMNQSLCRYEPHLLVTTPSVGTEFVNSDNVPHNVRARYSTGAFNPPGDVLFNFGELKNQQITKTFPDVGLYSIQCDVHSWMQGWIYVLPENCVGFFAVSAKDGTFTLATAPYTLADGDYVLEAWHVRFQDRVETKFHCQNGTATLQIQFDGSKSF